jgi:hypothetical protein
VDISPALARAVAHELNEELTVILNSVSSPSPVPDHLEMVEGAALRCAVLTRRLLAYSERRPDRRRPVPLDAILGDAA